MSVYSLLQNDPYRDMFGSSSIAGALNFCLLDRGVYMTKSGLLDKKDKIIKLIKGRKAFAYLGASLC